MAAPLRRLALIALPLALAACEHSAPGAVAAITDVGPWATGYPRRLTFNLNDDRTPSVTGGVLVYARQGDAYANLDYAPVGREECLAFLPVEGGTVSRLLCPHSLLPPTDTFVNTWFEPALSPDGKRVAFTWQRGPNVGPLGFASVYLTVASVDRPADTTGFRAVVNYTDGVRYADFASKVSWLDEGHLRFLATRELIFKVKGDGASRVTDTTYEPLALMDADLTTGVLTPVPGGDLVTAYAAAPSGGVWVVRQTDTAALFLLDPATGTRTLVGRFSGNVTDLAAVDSLPVAVVGNTAERLDPATGTRTTLAASAGPIHHIAAAGPHRFILEIEAVVDPWHVPPDLWLFETP